MTINAIPPILANVCQAMGDLLLSGEPSDDVDSVYCSSTLSNHRIMLSDAKTELYSTDNPSTRTTALINNDTQLMIADAAFMISDV